jgi:hypothetical protein
VTALWETAHRGQPVTDHTPHDPLATDQLVVETGHIPHALLVTDQLVVETGHIPHVPVVIAQVATVHTPHDPLATGQLVVETGHIPHVPVVIAQWVIDRHAQLAIAHSTVTAQPVAHHAVVAWVADHAVVLVAALVVLVVHQVEASVVRYQVVVVAIRAANAIRPIARVQFAHQTQSRAMGKDVDVAVKVARAPAF